jgi:LysM repeat protein
MFPFLNGFCASYPLNQARSIPPSRLSGEESIRLKNNLADLKHELNNHEAEIRIFENKLSNQESSLEQIRQQLADDLEIQKDYTRTINANLEGKIDSLEKSVTGLINDLRQLKNHANDSVDVLAQYKQKLVEVEKILDTQNQHISSLEAALHSLIDVWQGRENTPQEMANKQSNVSPRLYKVQSGDSLEKIARSNKITVKQLREYNQLTSDRIVIGQTIKIP